MRITSDNRLEVMRSIVNHDRLAYGVSQHVPQRSEFVKAAEPGSRFRPQNLLLLRPMEVENSQDSDDVRRDADKTTPPCSVEGLINFMPKQSGQFLKSTAYILNLVHV